ncbi:hypothetical protein AB1Y20_019855 [Prymnesium parvum]|uniref:Serine hydrolase domain-containing protein n=1 Tax=Prymnesium parvum TaxID=97485 RepID=A0AB34JX35_PRYPA
MAASAPPGKPRLLLLHGRNSNSEVSRMQAMILELDRTASCFFLDAPHQAGKYDRELTEEGRSWVSPDGSVAAAIEHVLAFCRAQGPFDGAYGFSQGCSIIAILSDPGVLRSLGVDAPLWRFVVCACGTHQLIGKQTDPAVKVPLAIPSLHIHGEADPILEEARALCDMFDRPHLLTHPWGHAVPLGLSMDQAFVQRVTRFITEPDYASPTH